MKKKLDEKIVITIRLNNKEIKEKVKKIAKDEGTFANEIYNKAIESYVIKYEKSKKIN